MKKLIAMVMMVVMLLSGAVALAQGIDLSAMSAEELQSLIDQARLELTKYLPAAADGTVLYEDENVRITFTGNIELDDWGDMNVPVIVENLSNINLSVILENVSCNGWSIWDASISVPAGKKTKGNFSFMSAIEDAELKTAEDVEDIEADLFYSNSDTWDYVIDPVHVTWLFGE